MTQIPQRLRSRREALGLSQRALAEMVGTQQSHICDLEHQAELRNLDVLRRWADALGFDVEVRLIDRGEVMAAHQLDNGTAHRLSADGAALPSSPCASASSDRIGTTDGSAL